MAHPKLGTPSTASSRLRQRKWYEVGSISYKYAGKAQHSKLKNKMVRHESRNPRLKTAGPRVPEENLFVISPVGIKLESKDLRQYVEIHREPDEEDLAVGTIDSLVQWNGRYACELLKTRKMLLRAVYIPRASTPR